MNSTGISFVLFQLEASSFSNLHIGRITHSHTSVAVSGVNFGWHLNTVIITSTEMTVASRAVAMAVMTEARTVDVEQEGHT